MQDTVPHALGANLKAEPVSFSKAELEKGLTKTDDTFSVKTSVTPVDTSVPSLHTADNSGNCGAQSSSDGSFQGYVTICGSFLCLFCTFGLLCSFGTFQSWFQQNQLSNLAPSQISWIGSLQLCTFFLSGGFVGRLFDCHGPKLPMIMGTVACVLSTVLVSVSNSYWHFILAQGVLFGFGVGLLFFPSIASVSTHFCKYRATAIGVTLSGSSIGGVVFPILLQHLFTAVGFNWAVRIIGSITFACCILALVTVTSRLEHGRAKPLAGFESINDRRYLLLIIGCCFVSLGLYVPYIYIVDFAIQRSDISPRLAPYILSVMNAGGAFGRIVPSYFSDICGRFNLLFPSAFFAGLLCLAFWNLSNTVSAITAFSIIYGSLSGTFISLINPCVFEVSQNHELGTRMGVLYSAVAVPSLFGGPIAGALLGLGSEPNYTAMSTFTGSTLVVGSLFLFASKVCAYVGESLGE